MSRVFNGSTQYLSASSTLLTNEPIGMFAWANDDINTAHHVIISLGDSATNNGLYYLAMAGDVGGDPVRGRKQNDAGTNSVADSTAGFSAGTWTAAGVSFRSDTSRDVYKDGANKGSNTTNVSDPTPDYISIGVLRVLTNAYFFDGSIAEVFIFDIAPTDAQAALLGKGIHPVDVGIPIANIRGWYPLLGNDKNNMAGGYPDLTATASPTQGAHPPLVISPRLGSRCSL